MYIEGFYWSEDYLGVLYCTGGVDQDQDLVYLTSDGDAWYPSIEQELYLIPDQEKGYSWEPPPANPVVAPQNYGGFQVGDLVKCILAPPIGEWPSHELREGEVYRVRELREGELDIYLETPDNGAPLFYSWDHKRFEAVSYPAVEEEQLWAVLGQGSACVRWGTLDQVTSDYPGAKYKSLTLPR